MLLKQSLMRREKFIYNKQTLRYEKVEVSTKEQILRIIGFTCAVVVSGFLFTLLVWKLFPSPQEESLLREIDRMKVEYSNLENSLEDLDVVLQNLQKRDREVHRMILEMDPIDENIWEGGIGGHKQHEDLKNLKHAGTFIAKLRSKTDKLKRQMYHQTKSLDDIKKVG